jgi:hypothetical protein
VDTSGHVFIIIRIFRKCQPHCLLKASVFEVKYRKISDPGLFEIVGSELKHYKIRDLGMQQLNLYVNNYQLWYLDRNS